MGANADGVVARVTTRPTKRDAARRVGRWIVDATIGPASLTCLATIVIVGGASAIVWSDHQFTEQAALQDAQARLDMVASLAAHETRIIVGQAAPKAEHLDTLSRILPAAALGRGRVAYLSDMSGAIVASSAAPSHRSPKSLLDLFSDEQHPSFEDDDAALGAKLRDGTPVIAAVRAIPAGYLTVVQPNSSVVTDGRARVYSSSALALLVTTGLVGLGTGCFRYRRRAVHARLDCQRLTSRLDTSLARGRCGLFDWDIARDRVFWSASMYRLLGYEPRDEYLSAGEAAALLHPEGVCLSGLMNDIAARTDRHAEQDVRARTATGQWLWLRVKAELVADQFDGTRHIVGFAIDVTEERGQAARRATADSRLRDAVESISEAFVLWDADRRLVLCNSKFLKLYELPPELAGPGTSYEDVLAAGRRPMAEKLLLGVRSHEPGTRTVEAKLSDGRWVHVNERRTKDGGVVSIGTDVTTLKRSEARLRERERLLQGSVREAESEKQRLAVLAERNIEANQAKTEFLARMSHEFRTPLNAIIGFADVMRSEIMGPLGSKRYAEYTQDIHASGLKLLEMVDGILQMSRLEKGQVTLSPELMVIDDVIDEALAGLAEDAAAKRLRIDLDIAEPALLQADRPALREVMAQVLRNAVKYTRPSGHIRIRTRPAGSRLNVFVEDNGVGIPADILPQLGHPFGQLEAEYSRAGGGPGLGLAIAIAIAELHGGHVRVRSQPGLGTIVLISLPVIQAAANDEARPMMEPSQRQIRLVAAE